MTQQHLPKSFNWPVRLGSFSKRAEDLLHALLTISAVARDFAVHECELKLRELGFGDVFDTYDLIYTGKRKSSVKEKDRAQWKAEDFFAVDTWYAFSFIVGVLVQEQKDANKADKSVYFRILDGHLPKYKSTIKKLMLENNKNKAHQQLNIGTFDTIYNFMLRWPSFCQAYVLSEDKVFQGGVTALNEAFSKHTDTIRQVVACLHGEAVQEDITRYFMLLKKVKTAIFPRGASIATIGGQTKSIKHIVAGLQFNLTFGIYQFGNAPVIGLPKCYFLKRDGSFNSAYHMYLSKGSTMLEKTTSFGAFVKTGDVIKIADYDIEAYKLIGSAPRLQPVDGQKDVYKIMSTPFKLHGVRRHQRAQCFVHVLHVGIFPLYRHDKFFGTPFEDLVVGGVRIYRKSDRKIHCVLGVNSSNVKKLAVHTRYKTDYETMKTFQIDKHVHPSQHVRGCVKHAVIMRSSFGGMCYLMDSAGREEIFGEDVYNDLVNSENERRLIAKKLAGMRTQYKALREKAEADGVKKEALDKARDSVIALSNLLRKKSNWEANVRNNFWKQLSTYLCREYEKISVMELGGANPTADKLKIIKTRMRAKSARIAWKTFRNSLLQAKAKEYGVALECSKDKVNIYTTKHKCKCGGKFIRAEDDGVKLPGTQMKAPDGKFILSEVCAKCGSVVGIIQKCVADTLGITLKNQEIKSISLLTIMKNQLPSKNIIEI